MFNFHHQCVRKCNGFSRKKTLAKRAMFHDSDLRIMAKLEYVNSYSEYVSRTVINKMFFISLYVALCTNCNYTMPREYPSSHLFF